MKNILVSPWPYRTIRISIGLLFVWSGLVKLTDIEGFAEIISAYDLVPEGLLVPVAIGIPALELIAGLGLILDARGSLCIIFGLLVMFVFVLWFGILKDLDIDCGCFSPADLREHSTLRSALFRDLWMIGAIFYLFWWRRITRSSPRGIIRLQEAVINFMKGGSNRMCKRKVFSVFLICTMLTLGLVSSGLCFGKKELETETIAVKFAREVARGGYNIVKTDELKGWIDQKKDMLIIDTMPYEASYKKKHVPGAVQFLFPIPEMTGWKTSETGGRTKEDFLKLLGPDKNKLIVFYCGFTKCGRSHNGAMWAVKFGYTNVYRHPGGIKAWKEAKYPVRKVK